MKILHISDLHNELKGAPVMDLPEGLDAVIATGDIDIGTRGVDWLAATFPGIPVVYVPGNHEFYDAEHAVTRKALNAFSWRSDLCNVTVLQHGAIETFEIGERRLVVAGATLWTDYNCGGNQLKAMMVAGRDCEDHKRILKFSPQDALREHIADRHGITEAMKAMRGLRKPTDVTVVATHHAPSTLSQAPKFRMSDHEPTFCSSLETLILEYAPDLWLHGHTHHSVDYTIGDTRIYSQQLGYGRSGIWQPQVIEV